MDESLVIVGVIKNLFDIIDWNNFHPDRLIDYYYYDDDSEEENSDSFFEPGEIPDQEIQVTLSDPEDIEKMLDAIYPVELSWISGEEFGVYNWDYRIDVTVVPKESSYSNPDEQVRILKSQEPSLLAERIRQAAVRD